MDRSVICLRCLRASRHTRRLNLASKLINKHREFYLQQQFIPILCSSAPSRAFSSQFPRRQQQIQRQPSTSETAANTPPKLPSKNARLNSSAPNTSAPDGASTAQMQNRIRASLKQDTPMNTLARRLRSASTSLETYVTYGAAEALFKSCAAQAPYTIPEESRAKVLTGEGPPKTASGEDIGRPDPPNVRSVWFDDISLLPTFSTWSQVTFLHMYLLTVKLRTMQNPEHFKMYQQYLMENLSQEAEDKMLLLHNITARGIRNRYLKDLFIQWRGILAAYDEGLVKDDSVLASAVWRNLFKGDEEVDWVKVGKVVCYMRICLRELDGQDVPQLPKKLGGDAGVWARSWKEVSRMVARPSKGARERVEG